ncbi:MAG: NADH:flavin oxidoreductase [Pseudomonadales bacterium]|nr:MAG: NADH:flavin oxidoreductase [Pseudomonadales bacterium]
MPASNKLFEAYQHEKLTLPNRVVMAPMTREGAPGGTVNQKMIDYYQRRAKGGVGLIITEAACIDHLAATGFPNVPFIGREDTADGWRQLVKAVHSAGAKVGSQLWHVGAVRRPGMQPGGDTPGYSPSGVTKPGGKAVGHVMSQTDIDEVIAAYAKGAAQAQATGFDLVEIHAAHGYLIDQFFWAGTNLRDDGYAGSLENRTRFGCEVTRAVRASIGEDMMLSMRISQWKQQDYAAKLCQTPQELERFLQPLVDAGIDIFHCSTRRFWEPEFEGSTLNLAGWVKKLTGKPTITVGSIGLDNDFISAVSGKGNATTQATGIDKLLARMEADEFDLAAVGRALIANPDWPNKISANRLEDLKDFEPAMLAALA